MSLGEEEAAAPVQSRGGRVVGRGQAAAGAVKVRCPERCRRGRAVWEAGEGQTCGARGEGRVEEERGGVVATVLGPLELVDGGGVEWICGLACR